MKNFSTIIDLENVLTDVSLTARKARYQAGQLYMELNEVKTDVQKVYYYDEAAIMSDITLDYAAKAEEQLKEVITLFHALLDEIAELEAQKEAKEGQ